MFYTMPGVINITFGILCMLKLNVSFSFHVTICFKVIAAVLISCNFFPPLYNPACTSTIVSFSASGMLEIFSMQTLCNNIGGEEDGTPFNWREVSQTIYVTMLCYNA